MSIESEARAEAEEHYPLPDDLSVTSRTLRIVAREHYASGYIAGATREVTDAEVRRACESLAHSAGYIPEQTVRAALTAARQVENTNHEGSGDR